MKLNYLTLITLTCLFLSACNNDVTNPIIVNTVSTSSDVAFVDETITLNIGATGYTDIEFIIDNSNVAVTEVTNTTYAFSATAAAEATIEIIFSADKFTEERIISLEFFEHGYIDFNVFEGITLDEDSAAEVRALHGPPPYIQTYENSDAETWFYWNKGFAISIVITDEVNIAYQAILIVSGYAEPYSGFENQFYAYPYEIAEDMFINNPQLSMSTVVERFGPPTTKFDLMGISETSYTYQELGITFYFITDNIDDYEGKMVTNITLD